MSGAAIIRLGLLLLTGLLLPGAGAEAAGRRAGSFAKAPKAMLASPQHRITPTVGMRHAGVRHPGLRHAGFREDADRRWRRGGRGLWAPTGYPGPWTNPVQAGLRQVPASGGDGSQGWIDRHSFEHMPVRMGIARAPTPQPTIYRLEGRRDRPATRVIRISESEPQGRRSRFAHAETGALLLTVPRR